MNRALPISWPDAVLQILELWFDEPGREEEKRKFIRNEIFEKIAPNLALKENINEEMLQSDPEIRSEVLIAREVLAELGTISPCLLVRKLKCSHSRAYEIFRELTAEHKDHYQTLGDL